MHEVLDSFCHTDLSCHTLWASSQPQWQRWLHVFEWQCKFPEGLYRFTGCVATSGPWTNCPKLSHLHALQVDGVGVGWIKCPFSPEGFCTVSYNHQSCFWQIHFFLMAVKSNRGLPAGMLFIVPCSVYLPRQPTPHSVSSGIRGWMNSSWSQISVYFRHCPIFLFGGMKSVSLFFICFVFFRGKIMTKSTWTL